MAVAAAIDEEDATVDGDLELLVLRSPRIRPVVDMNGFNLPLHHTDAIATSLVSTDVESASAITFKRIGSDVPSFPASFVKRHRNSKTGSELARAWRSITTPYL